MKYTFASFEVYYVNDRYETCFRDRYETFEDAKESCEYLVEHAIYIYGVIDKNRKILLFKEENPWYSNMEHIKHNFVTY
jgi:hypothetical protein